MIIVDGTGAGAAGVVLASPATQVARERQLTG